MKLSIEQIKILISKFYPYLKEKEIDILLSISKCHTYNNKEIILKSGRTDKFVFVILKGSARAYSINEEGEELNDHLRSEGYLFGDPRVFGDEAIQILEIKAIGEIQILKFDISKLEQIGFENPQIMKFYLKLLKEVIVTFSHRINTFVTMNSKERYSDLIKWNPLFLRTTYDKHIASFLGITPLTLHRVKKEI